MTALLAVTHETYKRIDRAHDRRWHSLADNDAGGSHPPPEPPPSFLAAFKWDGFHRFHGRRA